MSMKAIETVYQGYRMRSRLEARWGVFFDALGIKWEYEPEGFDLNGVYYLPDFWINEWQSWLEIKPSYPSQEEKRKCNLLWELSGKRCLMAWGSPYAYVAPDLYEATVDYHVTTADRHFLMRHTEEMQMRADTGDWLELFAECPSCEGLHLASFLKRTEVSTGGYAWGCRCPAPGPLSIDYEYARTSRIIDAYTSARQARFERGA